MPVFYNRMYTVPKDWMAGYSAYFLYIKRFPRSQITNSTLVDDHRIRIKRVNWMVFMVTELW